jgi:hypothetical protein
MKMNVGSRSQGNYPEIPDSSRRRPGRLKGRIRTASDFDEPLPDEILAAFQGGAAEAVPKGWKQPAQ